MKTTIKTTLIAAIIAVSVNHTFAQSTIVGNALSGTSSTTPTQYLGSSNAYDAIFKTAGVERMRLLNSNGALGIGTTTTSPFVMGGLGVKFQVNSHALITGLNSTLFFADDDSPQWGIEYDVTGGIGGLNFWRPSPLPGNATNVLFLKDDDKIGMGTGNPTANLHIFGALNPNLKLQGHATLEIASATSNGAGNTFALDGDAVIKPSGTVNGHASSIIIGLNVTGAPYNIRSFTVADDDLKIAQFWNGGKVQIGNVPSLPDGYKLFVETGILTEKVKIAVKTSVDWADYVFATDYKLMDLASVENFIKINKHLPNVPSATEVVKEGVDVVKMDALLLSKIEEMTLHLIEQAKQIKTLEAEVASMKQK